MQKNRIQNTVKCTNSNMINYDSAAHFCEVSGTMCFAHRQVFDLSQHNIHFFGTESKLHIIK